MHVSCILLPELSTSCNRLWVYKVFVPYTQNDSRFLLKESRGQPRRMWSLVFTIDGSMLSQDLQPIRTAGSWGYLTGSWREGTLHYIVILVKILEKVIQMH